ncbi:MAG: hypothetical protein V2A65_10440 [Candidatus Omnitrophota bacterium]
MREKNYEWSPELDTSVSGPVLDSGKGTIWLPAECDVPIRRDWFWTPDNEHTLKNLNNLMDIYYRSVGHGCNLLLNHTPDTSGLIPEADVKRAAEFGAEIRRRFTTPIASTAGRRDVLTLTFDKPILIDHIITMEEIKEGERVLKYQIEILTGENWDPVIKGTAVGHKKIDRIKPVAISGARFRCLQSVSKPNIRSFAVYCVT